MDYSEKWGKDVDEAVRFALEDLGLKEDQVMVTVLEEPTKGFLGLKSKLARVRVEKIADTPIIEETVNGNTKKSPGVTRDLRKKNRQNADSSGGGSRGGRDGGPRGGRDGGSRGGRDRDRDGNRDGGGRDGRRSGGSKDSRDSGRRHSHNRPPKKEVYDFENDANFDFDFSDNPQFSERPENLVEAPSSETLGFLKQIIDHMGLDVNIKALENDECVYLEIDGEDSKIVIGKRGQTLDSIQYLTNLIANKDKEEYRRVIIDVEGFRSRREKTLERLAVKLAYKSLKSGRDIKVEPMNPYERKVIHATLQKIDGVTTRSEGDEPYRRVVIVKERQES